MKNSTVAHPYVKTTKFGASEKHDVNTESLLKLTHFIWLYDGQVNNWKENGTRPNKIKKGSTSESCHQNSSTLNTFQN